MISRTTKIAGCVAVAALASLGYWRFSLEAAQGQGVLAQAPMNTQVQVPAAFITAVDDSGSMRFQTLFPGRDGTALWARDANNQPYGFFHSTGTYAGRLRGSDPTSTTREFVHVAPYPAPRQATSNNDNAAIPPIDAFGFARSHVYNKAYFDPSVTYATWKNADGTPWADATATATKVDPNSATSVTVNLTAVQESTSTAQATDMQFRIRTGMVLPTGMKFSGGATCGLTNDRSTASTPAGWRILSQNVTSTGDCNISISYFPATFYLPETAPAPGGFIAANRVLAANACSYNGATGAAVCNMYRYEIKPANYSSTAQYQAAITNFANWFSYYGARNRSMVAAMTNSLVTVNNLRVGFFTINNRNTVTMRDMADNTAKAALFTSIYGLGASGQTPNKAAVQHLGNQFMRTGAGAPIQLMCQKNAGMLFTDGFTNDSVTGFGNVDGTMGVPFQDGYSNTMADIAAYYYRDAADGGVAPLRSDAGFTAGQVPVPAACSSLDATSAEWKRLDCQPNLHMNFYGVTLGSRGQVFDPDVDRDPFTDPVTWPNSASGARSTVDDLWHAAVNTRGEYINAKTPADITAAMRRVLSSVSSGSTLSGTIARTGTRIGVGSLGVVPRYAVANEGTDWFSRLSATRLQVNSATRAVEYVDMWEAADVLAAQPTRNILAAKGATVVNFDGAGVSLADLCTKPSSYTGMSRCTAAELSALGVDAAGAVAYLRGSTAGEVRNGGRLRDRSTVLGDIVNSTPTVSSPLDDFGYRSLPDGLGTSYATYLESKRASARYMVYVGANDGMLHAFDGGMSANGTVDSSGGQEHFAYIPSTALGHMGNLLFPYVAADRNDQKFDHRYYVDGPVTVADAYYGGAWKSSLVGTAGAGGRSVFALDVSTPASFAAASRLWEISDLNTSLSTEVRANIGHVLGKPVIVPVKGADGAVSWKAIFGNGYNSASGKAVLYIVDIATGAPSIRMIEAVEGAATAPAGANGLGNVVVLDRWSGTGLSTSGRDGFADTVYAADQRGALWRFDLRSTASTVTTPVFVTATHSEGGASYRQPITGGLVASTGAAGGVMLVFGTGSFSFMGDPSNSNAQALYGVTDSGTGTITTINRSNLRPYTVSAGATTRQVTAGTAPLNSRGWYVQLPAGERFVGYPQIASGTVFMPTYAPQQGTAGCATQGFNWLYGLNVRTGGAALSGVRYGSPTGASPGTGTAAVALSTGGTAPVKDVNVSVVPRLQPPGFDPSATTPPSAPGAGCWMAVSTAGSDTMYVPYPCGRQSWRQLQ